MNDIAKRLNAYIDTHPFDSDDYDYETILDQLYMAYSESHEADPPEIKDAFAELNSFLDSLSLDDNNAVFGLTCRISIANGPVGLVVMYEQDVQDRVVELGLTTKAKISLRTRLWIAGLDRTGDLAYNL